MKKITIYIDGGSLGNPGPAAIGIVFKGERVFKKYSQFLGKATNNEAEYQALIFALKKAKLLFGAKNIKKIFFEIKSDSQLLVRQIQGCYKIKDPKIQTLFLKAWNLKVDFPNFKISLIPRQENQGADNLVNEVLKTKKKNPSLFLLI